MDGTFCNAVSEKLLGESIEEDELQLLFIGIPGRYSFFKIQYLERHVMSVDANVKEWMPPSEDIHVTTQGHMQLHDAEWRHEHPRVYTAWNIHEDEIHEYSDGIFKDAIGIE